MVFIALFFTMTVATIAQIDGVAESREAIHEADAKPDFALTWCTNFDVAAIAREIERKLDIPVVDATLLGMKQALQISGVDPSLPSSWGRLFQ
jgi:hypothetical protein